ncbi:MAG TPA: hypothetical protein VKN99_19390, partial [Polyangia bacterium]|nr:hypothetical protein [Polyangia bacterium]
MSRRSGAGGRICLLASVVQLVAAPVFASPGVLVFPRTPEAERYVAEAEQAVAKAGFGRVAFAPVAAQLSAAAERERERTRAALSEIERGLASVRQAYLEQRYAAMLTGLTDLESRALAVL